MLSEYNKFHRFVDSNSILAQSFFHPKKLSQESGQVIASQFLNQSLEGRLLEHLRKAKFCCAKAQEVISTSEFCNSNLRLQAKLESASVRLSAGKIDKAWDSIVSGLSIIREIEEIDPALRSYLHATEALCLLLLDKPHYAENALNQLNKLPSLPGQISPDFQAYSPLALLRQGQYMIEVGSCEALETFHLARKNASDYSSGLVQGLVRTFIDSRLAFEYFNSGEYEQAELFFRSAISGSVCADTDNTNLSLKVRIGLAKTLLCLGRHEEAVFEIRTAIEALEIVKEAEDDDYLELIKVLISNPSLNSEFNNTTLQVTEIAHAYNQAYSGGLPLSISEILELGRQQQKSGYYKESFETYSQAALKMAEDENSRIDLKISAQRGLFESSYVLNNRQETYRASSEILKLTKAMHMKAMYGPDGSEALLGIAYTDAALGAFLAFRHKRALRYLAEASEIFSLNYVPNLELHRNIEKIKGAIALEAGKYKVASRIYEGVLSSFGSSLNPDSLEFQVLCINLAWAKLRAGNFEGSREVLDDIYEDSLEHVAAQTKAIRGYLEIYQRGNVARAQRYIFEAFEAYSNICPVVSVEMACAYRWKGDLFLHLRSFQSALNAYQKSEAIFARNSAVTFDRYMVNRELYKAYLVLDKMDSIPKTVARVRRVHEILSSATLGLE